MTSKLVISQDRYVFHIEWNDDGEPGAWVGQDASSSLESLKAQAAKAKQRRDDDGWSEFEYLAVEIAAKELAKKEKDSDIFLRRGVSGGYEFESMAAAKRFLAAMKSAVKAARHEYDTGIAWPEWARQAHAAGWKPPKNWKP